MKWKNKEQIIYLVRHGEKQFFVPEPGLTELGREQARAAGKYLKNLLSKDNTLLLSSPKQRTQETALIIGQALGQNLKIDNDFDIHIRFPSQKTFLSKLDTLKAKNIVLVTHSQNIRQILRDFFQTDGNISECSVTSLKRIKDKLELVEAFRAPDLD